MKSLWALGMFFIAGLLQGQIEHPRASPAQTVIQQIGLCEVVVMYSRPAVKGRTVFGELVPYGRIWRVGANESTKIRFSCPVWIGEHLVPAGTYALYAFPEPDRWEIVIHKDTTHWGDGRKAYNPQEDLLRWTTAPEHIRDAQENFQIHFDSITHAGMQMLWSWDSTRIRIPLRVDTRAAMEKEIARALTERPTAQTYYEAARYLQEAGREFPRALSYVDQALEIGGETYYHYRVKSLILAGMNEYREAIRCARRSQELAAEEGKDEFVRMNQRNIAIWTDFLR